MNNKSSSSSSSSASDDDNDDADDDDDPLLPTDRRSLGDEIARVKETIQRLEEGTADDFVLGCELLLADKQTQVTRAYSTFERFKQTAIQLYEYECEQAKARYHARCAQLQLEMSDELEREIQRLKNTRDGVSVMDRRRFTRNSKGSGASKLSKSGSKAVKKTATKPLSAAEEAHVEKKRLEALLSKTPVFAPLTHSIAPDDAASDVDAIARAVRMRSGASQSSVLDVRRRVAFPVRKAARSGIEIDNFDSDSRDSVADSFETESALDTMNEDESRALRGGERLQYNPSMLQEGDRVVVHWTSDTSASDSRRSENEDTACVLSGVITASTATRVFLLRANGAVASLDVRDWKAGRIQVFAAAAKRRKRSHN